MKNKSKIFLGLSIFCIIFFGILLYGYMTEYIPYNKNHEPLKSPIAILDFISHSCFTRTQNIVPTILPVIDISKPFSSSTNITSYDSSMQSFSLHCGKYYIIPVISGGGDPYSQSGVININISQILAKHVSGGILVRGAWDTDAQGIFTAIPNADSFVQLKDPDGAPTRYYKAGNDIYMFKTVNNAKQNTQGIGLPIPTLIPDVDVATFVPGLSAEFCPWVAKDKSRVYLNGVVVSEIDPQTVVYIPHSLQMFKDKNHVYQIVPMELNSKGYNVTQYDPETFTIISGTWNYNTYYMYVKDKNGVYFGNRKIIGADPNTFSVFTTPKLVGGKGGYILYSYSKDNHAVYYSTEYATEVVPSADPQTFEPIDTYSGIYTFRCGKDKSAIYSGTTTVSSVSECQHYSSGGE